MSVAKLRTFTGAPLRDLLHLGLANEGSFEAPCVLPRERATLVQLGGVKAVIGSDEAMFFEGVDPSPSRVAFEASRRLT